MLLSKKYRRMNLYATCIHFDYSFWWHSSRVYVYAICARNTHTDRKQAAAASASSNRNHQRINLFAISYFNDNDVKTAFRPFEIAYSQFTSTPAALLIFSNIFCQFVTLFTSKCTINTQFRIQNPATMYVFFLLFSDFFFAKFSLNSSTHCKSKKKQIVDDRKCLSRWAIDGYKISNQVCCSSVAHEMETLENVNILIGRRNTFTQQSHYMMNASQPHAHTQTHKKPYSFMYTIVR